LIVAIHGGGFTSQYFDIPGCSLIERAAARGYGVIALDRLGYGRSRAAGKDVQTLAANAEWMSEAIDRLWPQFQEECAGVVLIGHSIGAALAVTLSAQPQSWPLAGVAVSGAGLTPNPALHGYFERFPADTWVETSADNKDRLMFGNPDNVKSGIAELVRLAYVPIATRELLEINTVWPQRATALLTSVEVPVHFRLAEQDALWVVNDEEVQALSDVLSEVAGSSSAIVSDAGHCIDFHNVGPQFQDDQLSFALDCCRL
jgi:pimeloyl-ACP methyl ester carboxylesterase